MSSRSAANRVDGRFSNCAAGPALLARELGVRTISLSLTHTGSLADGMVVMES